MVRFGWWLAGFSLVGGIASCKFESFADPEPTDLGAAGKSLQHAGGGEQRGDAGKVGVGGSSLEGGRNSEGEAGQGGQLSSARGGAPESATVGGAMAGAAGDAGGAGGAEAASECNIVEGCAASCEQQSATCTVFPLDFACEFVMAVGLSQEVGCGETVSVLSVNCGGCGTVDVKVYFDGNSCWQGVPDCGLSQFKDIMFREPN